MFTIVYFSPTGNVSYLAKKLAVELNVSEQKRLPLEFVNPESLEKNRHLVLIFPIHAFNAPRTVKRFTSNLLPGSFESISLIAVGCSKSWVNEAVTLDLRKQLNKKKITIAIDEVMAMPLTFIVNFPDELNKKLIAEAEKEIITISETLLEKKTTAKKVHWNSRLINFLGKGESTAAKLFGLELHATKSCTSCGICWNNCPEKNINQNKNSMPHFGFSCLMCMRCIYNCPEKAIKPRFSKFIPIKHGYSLSKYLNK